MTSEISEISSVKYMIETNEGTYGSHEARSAVGSAAPEFSVRRVYETVGGVRTETGPSAGLAPGRMRKINGEALAAGRRRLAKLVAAEKSAR